MVRTTMHETLTLDKCDTCRILLWSLRSARKDTELSFLYVFRLVASTMGLWASGPADIGRHWCRMRTVVLVLGSLFWVAFMRLLMLLIALIQQLFKDTHCFLQLLLIWHWFSYDVHIMMFIWCSLCVCWWLSMFIGIFVILVHVHTQYIDWHWGSATSVNPLYKMFCGTHVVF